tara:strand:- start:350 stop:628 length:279 start_codon:yes stop_codon:yes gene_type:complete
MKILKNGKLVTVTRAHFGKKAKVSENVQAEAPVVVAPLLAAEDVGSPYENNTVAQLKVLLDGHGVDYPKTAKKADLMELAESIEAELDSESI